MDYATRHHSPLTRPHTLPGWWLLAGLVLYASNTFLFVEYHASLPFWLGQGERLLVYLLLAAAMGAALLAALTSGQAWPLWRRMLAGALGIGAANGAALVWLALPFYRWLHGAAWTNSLSLWLQTSMLGMNLFACLLVYRALRSQAAHGHSVQGRNEELALTLERAEMAILDAQIEPHFLFNTLAHIRREYRHDKAGADRLVDALASYLDGALPALRRSDWTVGQELDLLDTYLSILAQRFGARLRFDISACAASRAVPLPALTIATLVENAVRHGLAPKQEAGLLAIRTYIDGATLHAEVCDDGVGLQASSGTGLALVTVRARLRNWYGNGARLLVEPGTIAGVRAAIAVPVGGRLV
ncbi:MAG: histidine kinase [Pseudomonadota bacterium]